MRFVGQYLIKLLEIYVASFVGIGLSDHFLQIWLLPLEMAGCSCSSQSGEGYFAILLVIEEFVYSFDLLFGLVAGYWRSEEEYKFLEIDEPFALFS